MPKIILIFSFLLFHSTTLADVKINVKVKRDSKVKDKMMYAYLVVMPPNKELFSLQKKMNDGFVKGSLPHYHDIGRAEDNMSKILKLQKGSYKAQVFLKSDGSDCNISKNGVPMGSCFPVQSDILCSSVSFEVASKDQESEQNIQCEVGSEV